MDMRHDGALRTEPGYLARYHTHRVHLDERAGAADLPLRQLAANTLADLDMTPRGVLHVAELMHDEARELAGAGAFDRRWRDALTLRAVLIDAHRVMIEAAAAALRPAPLLEVA